ncbi:hypothetical protein [Streptomyces sp. NPDC048191]|uniref:hypothetical protein n=1 Tax=Streptomyces sp. NPDC048191 TaxID=3155484 RepID=UPI0033C088DF
MDAMENSGVDGPAALLAEDARPTTPPESLEYQGHEATARFYGALPWRGGRVLLLVATRERAVGVRQPSA